MAESIKLEVGKRYRTRGGWEVTVLYKLKNPLLNGFEFVAVSHADNEDVEVYREDGGFNLDKKKSNADLVEKVWKE